VFSHPPRNPVSRMIVAAQNVAFRVLGRDFRVFVHPPPSMLGVLERHGLRHTFTSRRLVWQVAGLER
jgi:hypothetical protein